jgi:hypothetical protein
MKTKTIAVNHQSFYFPTPTFLKRQIVGRENLCLDTMKKSYMHVIN